MKKDKVYEGTNEKYRGLTITHAEFKAALLATEKDERRRLYPFVRKDVWSFYKQWKDLVREGQNPYPWEIDPYLFPLLDDLDTLPWIDTFDTSLDLKEMISGKVEYFV